jgi:hypothetical protein
MGFFDLIGERPQGYLEDNQDSRALQNRLSETVMNAPAITLQSTDDKAQAVEALMLQRAGFIQDPRGDTPDGQAYVDPRLLSSQATMSMINDQQEYLRQRTLQKANNPLFKVADTVADTGRMFLSPLFWLKGEDMTRYDPSAMLESGYRTRMNQLDALRIKSYDNYFDAKTQRLNQLTALQQQAFENADTMYQRGLPQDTFSKELRSEAERLGGDIYTGFLTGNAQAIQAVQNSLALNKGQATQFSDGRIVRDNALTPVRQISEKFLIGRGRLEQALEGYQRLNAALSNQGGIADVATIFSFMKMLDPTSVVREGEFAVAANAGGLFDRAMNLLDKYKQGEILPDTVRQEIGSLAAQLVATYGESYERAYGDAIKKASIYSWFDPDKDGEVFFGSRLPFPSAQPSAPTPAPTSAPPPLLDPNSANPAPASGADIFTVDDDLLR